MKEITPCYAVYFPLEVKSDDKSRIDTFFRHCCVVYNKVNSILSRKWREINEECKIDGKIDYKKRREIINTLSYNENGISSDGAKEGTKKYPMFSKYGIINIISGICKQDLGNGYSFSNLGKGQINVFSIYQTEIANRLFSAWDKVIKENARSQRKQVSDWNSMKSTVTGHGKHMQLDLEKRILSVKYVGGVMDIKFQANPEKREYEAHVFSSTIKQLGIKKVVVRGRERYYLTVTVEGTPFNKGRKLGVGAIGIDPGVSCVTCYGKNVLQYSSQLPELETEKARIQRYLDRSRRATNPGNFTEKGEVKRGVKLVWVKSKKYVKAELRLRELERSIADKRKRSQIDFVNSLCEQGNELHIEKNNISSWTKRKEGITKTEKGRICSNKRHGKSVSNAAPSQLLTIAKNKFTAMGGKVLEIDSFKAAATATDHTASFEKTKHPENVRTIRLGDGTVHDRDAHAAFNLKHCNEEGVYDEVGMKKDYKRFSEEEKKVWNSLLYQK